MLRGGSAFFRLRNKGTYASSDSIQACRIVQILRAVSCRSMKFDRSEDSGRVWKARARARGGTGFLDELCDTRGGLNLVSFYFYLAVIEAQ